MKKKNTFSKPHVLPFLLAFLPSLFLFFSLELKAQEVAISGFNSDSPDGIAFVVLRDYNEDEKIYFTDADYVPADNDFNVNANDIIVAYTVPAGGLTKGTVVEVFNDANPNGPMLASTGTVAKIPNTLFGFNGGEPLQAFSATDPSDPNGSISSIFSYLMTGGTAAPNPGDDGDCPCSTDFVDIDFSATSAVDGGNYVGASPVDRDNTTLADFETLSNWTTSSSFIALDDTDFTNLQFGVILPIELLYFHGQQKSGINTLEWATITEINNDYFVLERSMDARDWSEIIRVNGKGNSLVLQTYQYQDRDISMVNTYYYRLRQTDFDGTSTYHDVITISGEKELPSVNIWPNPIEERFTISFSQPIEDEEVKIFLINHLGQRQPISLLSFRDGFTASLPTSLASGTYFLEIWLAGQNVLSQIVVK